jgi:Protein of unknown function (DUF4058)
MPSPFPGMDPWLENPEHFRDFHGSLTTYLREALNAVLPPGYYAKGTQLVWVDEDQKREPDVGVFRPTDRPADSGQLAVLGAVAVADEPRTEPERQPYLEIRTREGRRLVTLVEILSPSNKASGDSGRAAYLEKQNECRAAGVHLVELDLLRGGAHTTAVPLAKLRATAGAFDYHVAITVCGDRFRYFAVPITLTDPLPVFPVPLDGDHPPVRIELQPLFTRTYDTGRCADTIDYATALTPSLSPPHAEWAEVILREKGRIT